MERYADSLREEDTMDQQKPERGLVPYVAHQASQGGKLTEADPQSKNPPPAEKTYPPMR
jgi:hypothetical protein